MGDLSTVEVIYMKLYTYLLKIKNIGPHNTRKIILSNITFIIFSAMEHFAKQT